MSEERFSGLAQVRRARQSKGNEAVVPEAQHVEAPADNPRHEAGMSAERRRRGEKLAKRNDPSYRQVSGYVRKDVYQAAKVKLAQQGNEQEVSELLEELLLRWVNS